MLQTMVPAKDIEDVEIMKHRYDGFEKEMNANASRVAVVNQLARQLLHVEHPNSEQIVARQNQVWQYVIIGRGESWGIAVVGKLSCLVPTVII